MGIADGGPPQVMPSSRAARMLGVTASWLKTEAMAGRIPGLQAGKNWLFDLGTVEKVLQRRAACGEGDVHAK